MKEDALKEEIAGVQEILTNFTQEDIIPRALYTLLRRHPDYIEHLKDEIHLLTERSVFKLTCEYPYLTPYLPPLKNDSYKWHVIRKYPSLLKDIKVGRPNYVDFKNIVSRHPEALSYGLKLPSYTVSIQMTKDIKDTIITSKSYYEKHPEAIGGVADEILDILLNV